MWFNGQRNLLPNPWFRILFVLEKSLLAQMAPPVAQLLGGHMDVVLCPRYFIFLVCFNDKFIEGIQQMKKLTEQIQLKYSDCRSCTGLFRTIQPALFANENVKLCES